MITARNARWADAEKTIIDLVVLFSENADEVPFAASRNDSNPRGRELFNRAANGDFGEIAEYSPDLADIEQLRSAKNSEINAARASANLGTFSHAGKLFACDSLSRSDIDGINGYVALNGSFPAGFPCAWKATDNTFLLLADIAAWKAFYASMVATGSAHFAHSQQLKAALSEATTIAEISAIVW